MATPYSVEEVKLEDGSKGVWLRDNGESGLQALITEQGGELASLKVIWPPFLILPTFTRKGS